MATIQIGDTTHTIEQVENPVTLAPDGSGSGVVSWRGKYSVIAGSLPVPLSSHPTYSTLLMYEYVVTREPGDMGRIDATYRGVLAEYPLDFIQEDVSVATSAEPIETHPLFAYPPTAPPVTVTQINLVQKALANNVTPDPTLIVPASAADSYYQRKRRGYDSYLRRGTTYRQNYCATAAPTDYTHVGYIQTPTDTTSAPPPPAGSPQNYICTGISWRRMGGVYYVTKEWQLSGPGGWDTFLYTMPP
jgi:hypothetical protein